MFSSGWQFYSTGLLDKPEKVVFIIKASWRFSGIL